MSVQLNHTIVWCTDKARSADFLTAILGLQPARPFSHFLVVELANGVSLDFAERITLLHFGEVIVEGTRAEVVADHRTREVYLGE